MNQQVQSALRQLYKNLVQRYQEVHSSLPFSTYREDWNSPCVERTDRDEGKVYWRPTPRNDEYPLSEVEQGLEIALHPDLLTYYGSFWADGIRVDSPWGEIGLIQVWNDEDLEFLKENLLGHAFVRLKRRSPLSFFIGVQRGDHIITIDNERGVISRERLGKRGDEILCDNLESFLRQLTPNLEPYDEFQ